MSIASYVPHGPKQLGATEGLMYTSEPLMPTAQEPPMSGIRYPFRACPRVCRRATNHDAALDAVVKPGPDAQ